MMHLVEGPDGVGKTTFARHLARSFGLPLVEDVAKGRVPVEAREAVYVAHVSVQEQIAPVVDFVADRGWLSTLVYARSYGRKVPDFLVDCVKYARKMSGVQRIYYVRSSPSVAFARIGRRGEEVDEGRLLREFDLFDGYVERLEGDGFPVVYVDGERGGCCNE